MLTWVATFKFYRFIKSGLLFDFLFKKLFVNFLNLQFIFYNNFVEKYYVEFLFLRIKDYSAACVKLVDTYSREFVFSSLVIFLLVIFIFLLVFTNQLTFFWPNYLSVLS